MDTTIRLKKIDVSYSDKQKAVIWVLTLLNRSRVDNRDKVEEEELNENSFFIYLKQINVRFKNNPYIRALDSILNRKTNGLSSQTKETAKDKDSTNQLAAIKEMIEATYTILEIPAPANQKKLIENMYFITSIQYGKPFVIYHKDFYFYEHLVTDLSIKFEYVYQMIGEVFNKHGIHLYDYQIMNYLYNLVINWKDLLTNFSVLQKKIELALYLTTDADHAILVRDYINYKLPEKFNISIVDQLPRQDSIYSLTLTDLQDINDNLNIFSISELPSPEELDWLDKFYRKRVSNNIESTITKVSR